jgi:hypothetical protein
VGGGLGEGEGERELGIQESRMNAVKTNRRTFDVVSKHRDDNVVAATARYVIVWKRSQV